MTDVNDVVARNFANYRRYQNLSLDKVSELTGVSKNMLSQIEKGQSNPSIMTLSKIANGLHLSLSQLITDAEEDINQIDHKDLIPIYNEDHTVVIYPYFPYSPEKNFEMFKMILNANSEMASEGHYPKSDEYIIVTEGTLKIDINGTVHHVAKDQAIHFKCDVPHAYFNEGDQRLSLIATIQYHD